VPAPLVLNLHDDASEGDAQANAFSHRKLDVPFASLAISVVPARTLRSPIVGIGTKLLAHREKIEVTQHGSPCARSPGECLKSETRWRMAQSDANYSLRQVP
jgi:hypothetical protein